MKKKDHPEATYEEGSGNVFADLGLEDADELHARAQSWDSTSTDFSKPESSSSGRLRPCSRSSSRRYRTL